MATVQATVNLRSNPEGTSLEPLEAQIAQAVQQAGRQLILEACRSLEADYLQAQGPRLGRGTHDMRGALPVGGIHRLTGSIIPQSSNPALHASANLESRRVNTGRKVGHKLR